MEATLNKSNPLSPEFTPTSPVSDCVVDLTGYAGVALESKAPNTGWQMVTTMTGHFSVNTPSADLSYRFRYLDGDSDVNVYMGP